MTKEQRPLKAEEVHTLPLLERIVATLGVALVVGVLGFTLFEAFNYEKVAPEISFEVQKLVEQDRGYLVMVRAKNRGAKAATNLWLEGEAKDEEGRKVLIDYLPPHGKHDFGIFFSRKPEDLTFRPLSFELP